MFGTGLVPGAGAGREKNEPAVGVEGVPGQEAMIAKTRGGTRDGCSRKKDDRARSRSPRCGSRMRNDIRIISYRQRKGYTSTCGDTVVP